MKKNYSSLLAILFILGIFGLIYFTMMPQWTAEEEKPLSEFCTNRALNNVAIISAEPHYVGTEYHKFVANYLEKELQNLGLETTIQEGTTLSDWGNLVKSKNILARIKGTNNSKALLLLSHYDSAPHSNSYGASDDASGVATILEGVRTFIHNKTPHKNDIIILFTDAEELGLNGAALFVTQSKWAKEVGLSLNFEARGSGGPSYMLMEVNQGNAEMIKGFSAANTEYPVSNSLMYSIYKMLPNDTDLTVFREQGNIPGFNFAFIDNHFNYHTEQDIVSNLSPKTLKHQGTYLMPLLNYFSNANLNNLNSKEDYVYFNIPFYFVIYPFKWIIPMLLLTIIAFLIILSVGIGKRVLTFHEIGKGFIPLFASLITAGLVAFLSWKGLQIFYPQYKDILQGFTYNGHAYIGAFVFLSLSIGFFFYRKSSTKGLTQNHFIAPLILWIIINSLLAFLLPGAGFLIIPLIFGVLMFAYFVITQTLNRTINLILSIPALIILVPFIVMFPVGLGLKILVGSAILTILIFGLLLPVFGTFPKKGNVSLIMLLISIGFFVNAHINSDYEKGKAKPNSLLYILNADKNTAIWATYDTNLDNWTKKYLGQNPKKARLINSHPLFSKYNSGFTFTAFAPMKELSKPTIEFVKDTIIGTKRYLKIKITPNRKVNRYDIFANEKMVFYNFNANGATSLNQKGNIFERKGKKVISYYVVDNEPLEMQFSISKNTILDMDLMESSFDLVTNPKFNIIKRTDRMMPMPFVLTDAVIIQQKIKQSPKTETPVVVYQPNQKSSFINDTLTSTNESN